MNIINLSGVTKIFRTSEIEIRALDRVSFVVDEGEFVSVMGPSGCGKSTLLNLIGLLDNPTEGHIAIADTDITRLTPKQRARFRNEHIGFVFQSFHLIPSLSVRDNVELPLTYRDDLSARERRRRVEEVLDRVELSHRIKHRPGQLSGGQCQRVAIARAIVGNPRILLADEPTGNLDSQMGADIMRLLQSLNQDDGRTIVMVTHNESQARLTHRILRFLDGHLKNEE